MTLQTLSWVAQCVNGIVAPEHHHAVFSQFLPLTHAGVSDLSFCAGGMRYREQLKATQALAVLVHARDQAICPAIAIIVSDVHKAYAIMTQHLTPDHAVHPYIHPTATLDPTATIAKSAFIGPYCMIGKHAIIGEKVCLKSHVTIGDYVNIGDASVLHPQVTLYPHSVLGQRVILHAGVVLGADGFGWTHQDFPVQKIHHLGYVIIGDDVEIGANSCVDRGVLMATTLGDRVKVDNLVHIGHNTSIGPDTLIAGCATIAGSVQIGARCKLGGRCLVNGHLNIPDDTTLIGGTTVGKTIVTAGVYASGMLAEPLHQWKRNVLSWPRLSDMVKRWRVYSS
jgi:UDP-3-O-[3-hydroxymyristoyl] glucosamine N-acyltransferase